MSKLLQVIVIGMIIGSIYGFIAIGMVLVYRTTGVLNIAHGGIGILSAYVARDLIVFRDLPYYVGIGGGILFGCALGLLFEFVIVRRLPGKPGLQSAATLGLYVLLQGITFLPEWWVNQPYQVFPSPLADKTVRVPGTPQSITYDQLLLVAALGLFSAGLYFMLRRTRVGMAMRAVSDDASAAGLMGINPGWVSQVVWTVAFGLSALTTMLVAPITLLDNIAISMLTLKALTVAFLGALVSLPLTVAAALILGVLESASDLYWFDVPELKEAWPFLLMLVVLTVRFASRRTTVADDAPVVAAS